MINKQGLWFLTLFSLILVLSVYYITMPNELFKTNGNVELEQEEDTSSVAVDKTVSETDYFETLKVELEASRDQKLDELEAVMNSSETNTDEKNQAYEEMKTINEHKAIENNIITILKQEMSLDTFVKIEQEKVLVVVKKAEHDVSLANKIMRRVQQEFSEPMSISVKFS